MSEHAWLVVAAWVTSVLVIGGMTYFLWQKLKKAPEPIGQDLPPDDEDEGP